MVADSVNTVVDPECLPYLGVVVGSHLLKACAMF